MISPFWKSKSFTQMTQVEWESLCDGCGKCCLHKLEDEEDGEVYYTDIACKYLDDNSCHCKDYSNRLQLVPECLQLRPQDIAEFHWLPKTCSYRLLAGGDDLPQWHHLLSGKPELIHQLGFSVKGRTISEEQVAQESDGDYQERVIHWIE
ncbi:MAG: putative cysteine cluster protein YcgN (CxxCxxCC family) [Candidatus Endobugula sp.]|jgi:uncharacterized cysteine cluster protein YcgN (CxxCxxCC family)